MDYCTLDGVKSELNIISDDNDDILQAMIEQAKEFIDSFCNREFDTIVATSRYFDGANILFVDDLVSIDAVKIGVASATTALHLIDATLSPFLATDVGSTVYNTTDRTSAIITVFTSTSDITLDTDIMTIGEGYSIGGFRLDTDGDGAYESTLATTDYKLYPLNKMPKTRIEISSNSNYGGFASGVKKGVEIKGTWGYASTIPKAISRASMIQVCRWFKRKDSAFATVVGVGELGMVEISRGLDPDIALILKPYMKRIL